MYRGQRSSLKSEGNELQVCLYTRQGRRWRIEITGTVLTVDCVAVRLSIYSIKPDKVITTQAWVTVTFSTSRQKAEVHNVSRQCQHKCTESHNVRLKFSITLSSSNSVGDWPVFSFNLSIKSIKLLLIQKFDRSYYETNHLERCCCCCFFTIARNRKMTGNEILFKATKILFSNRKHFYTTSAVCV